MAATSVDGVSQLQTAGTLGEEGAGLPATNGDKLTKHPYPGTFHKFKSFPGWVMEGKGDGGSLFIGG